MNFIQNKIRDVILQQASNFFKDIDSKNLSLAASKGDITLKDLELKDNAIDLGDQPFKVVSGKFQTIDLKVPFSSIFSEPCIIVIEGVDLKVELKSVDKIVISKEEDFKKLKNGFIAYVQQQFKKEFGQSSGGGITDFWMIKNAVERIFDNLQVSVKRVNITVQDRSSNNSQIRVSLGELEMKTTDSSYMKAVFVKRGDKKNQRHVVHKRIIFSNFMVSVGELENRNALRSSQNTNDSLVGNRVKHIQDKENTLFKFSFTAKVQITPPLPAKSIINKEQENPIPQYLVNVNISTYTLRISQSQLQRILRILENMQLYNNKVLLLKDRGSLKPQFAIYEVTDAIDKQMNRGSGAHKVLDQKKKSFLNGPHKDVITEEQFEDLKNKKRIIVNRWWKYAILSVLKKVKSDKKEQRKERLLGIVDGGGLDKMFEFRLPLVVKDVYESEMDRIVDNIVHDNLNDENL